MLIALCVSIVVAVALAAGVAWVVVGGMKWVELAENLKKEKVQLTDRVMKASVRSSGLESELKKMEEANRTYAEAARSHEIEMAEARQALQAANATIRGLESKRETDSILHMDAESRARNAELAAVELRTECDRLKVVADGAKADAVRERERRMRMQHGIEKVRAAAADAVKI